MCHELGIQSVKICDQCTTSRSSVLPLFISWKPPRVYREIPMTTQESASLNISRMVLESIWWKYEAKLEDHCIRWTWSPRWAEYKLSTGYNKVGPARCTNNGWQRVPRSIKGTYKRGSNHKDILVQGQHHENMHSSSFIHSDKKALTHLTSWHPQIQNYDLSLGYFYSGHPYPWSTTPP